MLWVITSCDFAFLHLFTILLVTDANDTGRHTPCVQGVATFVLISVLFLPFIRHTVIDFIMVNFKTVILLHNCKVLLQMSFMKLGPQYINNTVKIASSLKFSSLL